MYLNLYRYFLKPRKIYNRYFLYYSSNTENEDLKNPIKKEKSSDTDDNFKKSDLYKRFKNSLQHEDIFNNREKINYRTYNSPTERAWGILKDDFRQLFGQNRQHIRSIVNPGIDHKEIDYMKNYFPEHNDFVIIGGGAVGASIAFHLQEYIGKQEGGNIVIIDKDHTYRKASSSLSCGGIRQQFSLPENVLLSQYGFEFLRDAKQRLHVDGRDEVNIDMHFGGYLTLATEKTMPKLMENHTMQRSYGATSLLLSKDGLGKRFPWLNTEGIEGGVYGIHGEGWFDPWSLLLALSHKLKAKGARFVEGEVTDVEYLEHGPILENSIRQVKSVTVSLPSGQERKVRGGVFVLATGAWSGGTGYALGIGRSGHNPLFSIPLPVEPRKRYVYTFRCDSGPGLDCPLLVEPDGTYFRREGLGGLYICGSSPHPKDEPAIDDLSVDDDYFQEKIWPVLANRVPNFNSLKLMNSWAGYYDFNTFDENGIVGHHPAYANLILATGFSGHGLQHSLGIGRAVKEWIVNCCYDNINLERLKFDRLINNTPIYEDLIV